MKELKVWVVEQVQWAETTLKGRSGPEKKSSVLRRIDELAELPWYLDWMTDEKVLGGLVDWAVAKLNLAKLNRMFGRDFAEEKADAEMVANADVRTETGESLDARADALVRESGAPVGG